MVMMAPPLFRAVEAIEAERGKASAVVLMSPQGARFDQAAAERLSRLERLILICGRYEGIDERAAGLVDVELSLGDFVISGGELAAMALVDAVARLIPGALGDEQSAENDSFSSGWLDHPHYTRPEDWQGGRVPEVLLSGDHAAVRRWRLKRALGATWLKRPELLSGLTLDQEQDELLREFIAEQQQKD